MDNLFDSYENWRLDQEFGPVPPVAEEPKPVQVAQTPIVPMPKTEVLTEIAPNPLQQGLGELGVGLEKIGNLIDEASPLTLNEALGTNIPILGELTFRDLVPLIGSKQTRQTMTGTETRTEGTPAALQAVGRGESLIRGKGATTSLTPDAKLMAADVLTTTTGGKAVSKGISKGISAMTKAIK
jgi:hypothetical protein